MKTFYRYLSKILVLFFCMQSFGMYAAAQGRVVINEFMAWAGCNTTSEFVELMNFGPGPMNIGCYIVTNGKYSVTIPPNTILQAGQYYVLSGQDWLAKDCGNVDSTITVNLNWNNCNCTNVPIPTTGDGFFQNGGSANEKVVLLDPQLNAIDAVSRYATPSSSVPITTASINGACAVQTFDLNNMSIRYESINSSTGINNSFARKVDGDCGWVKTTDISAAAQNKTGSSASTNYSFTTLTATECKGTTGSIAITVDSPDGTSVFPMNYTLAFDIDGNDLFDAQDQYSFGVDETGPHINIDNLVYGRYRITVGSALGCNLKTFDFYIFNCYGVVILSSASSSLVYKGLQASQHAFEGKVSNIATLQKVELESSNGGPFEKVKELPLFETVKTNAPITRDWLYRLRLVELSGAVRYSQVVSIPQVQINSLQLRPNPASHTLWFQVVSPSGRIQYTITNMAGTVVARGQELLLYRNQEVRIPINHLSTGFYQINVTGEQMQKPLLGKFFKY